MKIPALLALALSTCLVACGDSSANAKESDAGSGPARVTDPEQLPSDQAGLAQVYESLMDEAVALVEGIETREQLEPALEQLAELGPSFAAVMQRSEELGVGVEEGLGQSLEELGKRMQAATKELFAKFPTDALAIQNAMTSAMGGDGPR